MFSLFSMTHLGNTQKVAVKFWNQEHESYMSRVCHNRLPFLTLALQPKTCIMALSVPTSSNFRPNLIEIPTPYRLPMGSCSITNTSTLVDLLVQDDPNPLDDGGEIPKSQRRGRRLDSQLWNLLSTWHNTCQTVNCSHVLWRWHVDLLSQNKSNKILQLIYVSD